MKNNEPFVMAAALSAPSPSTVMKNNEAIVIAAAPSAPSPSSNEMTIMERIAQLESALLEVGRNLR